MIIRFVMPVYTTIFHIVLQSFSFLLCMDKTTGNTDGSVLPAASCLHATDSPKLEKVNGVTYVSIPLRSPRALFNPVTHFLFGIFLLFAFFSSKSFELKFRRGSVYLEECL